MVNLKLNDKIALCDKDNSKVLAGWKEELLNKFRMGSWPDTSEPEWRRTDLSPYHVDDYHPQTASAECVWENAEEFLPVPNGLVVCDLKQAFKENNQLISSLLEHFLQHGRQTADNRFEYLGLGMVESGFLVYVPAGLVLEKELRLRCDFKRKYALHTPYIFVYLEEGARAQVVVHLRSMDDNLISGGADYYLSNKAHLNISLLEDLGPEALFFWFSKATQESKSFFHSFEALLGANLIKTRLTTDLAGCGAQAQLQGAYWADGSQHMDIRTVERHNSPDTASRTLYKGAVCDTARTIFQGLIKVAPGAERTDAFLTNNNIVLNDGARADSIPSLQIDNNNVKCSHGSTTGKLDENKLFYLKSRGYEENEAVELLLAGYFEGVLQDQSQGVKSRVNNLLEKRMKR